MGKKKVLDLYRAPFPLYSVKVDAATGLVITAGGGGASKTGIQNAVHFLDLKMVGENQYSSSLLHSHNTDKRATMNMAVGDGVIAAGQDGTCSLMKFNLCRQKEDRSDHKDGNTPELSNARRRPGKADKGNLNKPAATGDKSDMRDETDLITVTNLAEVLSDLNPNDPLQKVVRFSPDMKLLLTGGTDGFIRVWEFPSLKKQFDFKAHEEEIEDLDMSVESKLLVTVGRDFTCTVWSGNQMITGLKWCETMPQISEKSYRYMACRFGNGEEEKDALRLYTVQIPHKRHKNPPPCYITKWDGKIFLPMLTSHCGTEVISSLAVSDSGKFLGLGTVTGSVAIYIAFSLQKLYYVNESHGIVVTDLAFLPDFLKGQSIKGSNKTAMLSVAVDSRCQIHAVTKGRPIPVWLLFCGFIFVGLLFFLQFHFQLFL
ncbi:PREDICTED: prolactin regulatory element-binding protein [Cyprinodon variegatus]|uniref:Prolactin regulatory element binding n=1 Tax=Cyprinodon variegatus TaxID=28743 RepID=A0A3Q2D196_CYPVA|nr:PREDICTED: prolactin regulatory element-binding protein [Cyprinodon variegatus]